jgi:signal peptidase II
LRSTAQPRPVPAPREGRAPASWRRRLGVWGLAGLWLLLDQATKAWAVHGLRPDAAVPVVGSWLSLTLVRNRGMAFSLWPGHALGLVAVAAAVAALALGLGPRLSSRGGRLGAALVAGGAVGNALDRWLHGFVVDFIRLPLWPVFNLADLGVTVGGLILVVSLSRPGGARPDRP